MALNDQQFNVAFWLATHRKELRAVAILGLSTIAALVWGTFLYFLVSWVWGIASDGKMLYSLENTIVNFDGFRATHSPVALDVSHVVWNKSSSGSVQVVAKVKNTNKRWVASVVTYSAKLGTEAGPLHTTSVLPGEEKFLPALDVKFNATPSDSMPVTIVISSVSWRWLELLRDLPNVAFSVMNVRRDGSTRIDFDVTNESVYGFWSVPFVVVATRREGPVDRLSGVTVVQVEMFEAGQLRTVSAYSPEGFGNATSVEIRPDINVLDRSVIR